MSRPQVEVEGVNDRLYGKFAVAGGLAVVDRAAGGRGGTANAKGDRVELGGPVSCWGCWYIVRR